MKLTPIASNMTEVDMGDVVVMFSYSTPVAALVKGDGYYRTEKKWSMTTSRHINKWLNGIKASEAPQDFFDNLTAKAA